MPPLRSFLSAAALLASLAATADTVGVPEPTTASDSPPSLPPFPCPTLPTPPPSDDVRRLRPGNIDVVMSLGDSIGAGFCMTCKPAYDLLDLFEYRELVYDIGGAEGAHTLPNYLRHYNPKLVGAAVGKTLPLDAIKWRDHIVQPFDPRVSHLNAAQSQAKIEDVPAQVDYLAQQLRTVYNGTVDFEGSWKMLTLLIGANNLCGACKNRSYADPDYYEAQLETVLAKVHAEIPRVFVNLLPIFDIGQVHGIASQSEYCRVMWKDILKTECMCLQGDATAGDRAAMDAFAEAYRARTARVAAAWEAKGLSEFAVRVQPFMGGLVIPSIEFLSELDCFHPSLAANQALSLGLWNSILSPASEKPHGISPGNDTFKCPTQDTFLQ